MDLAMKKNTNSANLNGHFLQNIIDNLPHAIFWKDKTSIILGCNQLFAEMAGFISSNEIIGKTDHDLPWKEYADKYIADDQAVIQQNTAKLSYEEENVQADGSLKTVLASKVPLLNDKSEIAGVLGIFTDITDLKELEKVRQEQLTSMEVINKLELMAIAMAHELRTPLTGITFGVAGIEKIMPTLLNAYEKAIAAELISPTIRAQVFENLKGVIERINRQIHYCNNIITMQLKNISTTRTDMDKSNFSIQSIKEIIDEAVETYPFETNEKELLTLEDNIDFNFFGDRNCTIHIIWNLIKNALYQIKSANKGQISLWSTVEDNYHCLHFKDTGTGIDEEIKEKIFDKFFTTSPDQTGTGIGLSFTKLVIESFKGKIVCEGKKSEYTEFKLYFPKLQNEK